MNKFDNINSSYIRSSYPTFDEVHPYLNYLKGIQFWSDEFKYLSDKSLSFIIDNIYSGGNQWYSIDDILYDFSKHTIRRTYDNKDFDGIRYLLDYYKKMISNISYSSSSVVITSSFKQSIIIALVDAFKALAYNIEDRSLVNLLKEYDLYPRSRNRM